MSGSRLYRLLRHLPVFVGGRPLHDRERYRPFFIVGSGRCGSTLVRAMLQSHPDLHIPPENLLGPAIRAYRRYSRLPWSVVLKIVLTEFEFHPRWERFELPLQDVYQALAARPHGARTLAAAIDALYRAHMVKHKPGATRWGDKTPLNTTVLPDIRRVFPDLQVVHVLRDGRDVVESFMRTYGHDLAFSAGQWLGAVRAARAFGARHAARYHEVRYEALVRRPEETIRGVSAFLGVGFDERMLRHHEQKLRLGDVEQFAHLHGVREAVHQRAVGRWRTGLAPAQVAELERLIGPTLAALGYGAGRG